ncbi:MAG: hypothetical protein PHX27_01105 [Candidatus ainarchaeum sp.]|nr:hypothetical protein [Candidatus ainarchaeum sp.]
MIYHVITTPECNLCCEYCFGTPVSPGGYEVFGLFFDNPENGVLL